MKNTFGVNRRVKKNTSSSGKVLECNELVGQIAEEIKEANDIFYLGRGVDYFSYGRCF